jgi:hypothetical protein
MVPANPRIKNQSYCNREQCQKARKAKWQREKMANDPLYRRDQKKSNDDWLENNQGYWKDYRENHPEYTNRNRKLQKIRDLKRHPENIGMGASDMASRKMDGLNSIKLIISDTCEQPDPDLAKMDASDTIFRINPGIYYVLNPKADLAKMDALNQQYLIIPVGSVDLAKMDKISFR